MLIWPNEEILAFLFFIMDPKSTNKTFLAGMEFGDGFESRLFSDKNIFTGLNLATFSLELSKRMVDKEI